MPIIETRPQEYCAEASSLGWVPGVWPKQFTTDGFVWTLMTIMSEHGDVMYVKYVDSKAGRVLTVWND